MSWDVYLDTPGSYRRPGMLWDVYLAPLRIILAAKDVVGCSQGRKRR